MPCRGTATLLLHGQRRPALAGPHHPRRRGAAGAGRLGVTMDHAGHHHGVLPDLDMTSLSTALGLIVSFMVVEVLVGILASSLALLSDAAHMLTDATAIGLSLVAIRLAQRPAEGVLTFGLKRA